LFVGAMDGIVQWGFLEVVCFGGVRHVCRVDS
jgi:hypothetical protein